MRVDNILVNHELVKEGLAWVYVRYCKLKLCAEWQSLEIEAQEEKRGLWGARVDVPPWEFRRQKRKYKAPVVSLKAN